MSAVPPRAIGPDVAPEPRARRLVDGATFILDEPEQVPAVWGDDDQIAMAQGEPLWIVGPIGVGKTTIAQQFCLARAGTTASGLEFLGMGVTPDPDRPVLYLAGDRPRQAARSFRRMVTEVDRHDLREKLIFWRGPLDFLLDQEPDRLVHEATTLGVGTVVIDSLKDYCSSLVDDKSGIAINRALQLLVGAGIEVVVLHHQRKAQGDNKRPKTLADVYGSVWLTAGAGSVILLWGEPGDPVVELHHLKQPADDIGPLSLLHDHTAGRTTVIKQDTAYDLVKQATSGGIEVKEVARLLNATGDPTPNQVEKARRKLNELVTKKFAVKVEGESSKAPTRYRPVIARDSPRDHHETDHGTSRLPATPHHAPITQHHAPIISGPPSPIGGGRDGKREAEDGTELRGHGAPNATEGDR